MDFKVLKEEKGGYKKAEVLTKVEAYTMLLMKVQAGQADRITALAELETIGNMELTRESTGFFSSKGFSVQDTEEYLATLEEEINKNIR